MTKKREKLTRITFILLVITMLMCLLLGFKINKERELGQFDVEITPLHNLTLLLDIIDRADYCDHHWYQDVEEYCDILKAQVHFNQTSENIYVKTMMNYQKKLIKKLKKFSNEKKIKEKDINELQKVYNEYQNYIIKERKK